MTTAQDGAKIVSLTHRPPLPPENTPGTHFCYRLSRPQDHSAIGRILCQLKFPVTPSGVETATFRFVAQHLNHCATAVPGWLRVPLNFEGRLFLHHKDDFVRPFQPIYLWGTGLESPRDHRLLRLMFCVIFLIHSKLIPACHLHLFINTASFQIPLQFITDFQPTSNVQTMAVY